MIVISLPMDIYKIFKIQTDVCTCSTVDLLCVENVHVEIVNTTAVQVFWSSLSLLPGVTISHYTIHYQETNDKLPQRQANSSLVNSSVNCHTTIGGLNEGIWYSFVVIATLTEEGGRNIDIGSCSERIDVFLPGLYPNTFPWKRMLLSII